MKYWKKLLNCFCLALLILALSACSFGPKPEDTAKELLDATIAKDLKKQNELALTPMSEEELNEIKTLPESLFKGNEKLAEPVLKKMEEAHNSATYELKKTETKGDRSTVTVEITGKDTLGGMMEALQTFADENTVMEGDTLQPKMPYEEFEKNYLTHF